MTPEGKVLDFTLPATEPADFGPSDLGNAVRFAAAFGERLRYCHRLGAWFVYDGTRWIEDDGPRVQEKAKVFAGVLLQEAAVLPSGEERKLALRHALYSDSARGIGNFLSLAKNELPVRPADLDRDPWLLNCLNGTLDLRTGALRPHRAGDYITKLAPVAFEPTATLDLWERFLDDATGADPEMIDFLARFAGYCLTGDTGEEKLIFIHGPAASGKSTFVEALKGALGDYAATADFETFLARTSVGGPRPDLARLAGARFVASVEVEEGRRLASGLVRMLTGGDTVTVRRLYSEEFEYRPQFKLVLVANDPPRMKAADSALWRRVLVVPFERSVPAEKRDPLVKATLRDPAQAGAAVLAWAFAGLLDWQQSGLGDSARIRTATEGLREENDPVRDFSADCLTFGPGLWTSASSLAERYRKWCDENSEKPVSANVLASVLKSRGCTVDRKHGGRGWLGVALPGGVSP